MAKFYLVAKHEYLKLVKKRSFIISTLGVPVLYAVIIVVSIMASVGKRGELPVGYVDYAGVLSKPLLTSSVEALETVTFQAFDTQEHALEKLRAKQLQAVYILPAHYAQTGKVELYYLSQRPSELARSDFEALIKAHLMSNQPVQVQARLQEGNNLIIRAADNSREFDSRNILTFIVPFVAAFLFIIAVMNAGGYMLAAVTEEKENRTIEILSTSLRPEELIGGKALGLMGVGLSQLLIWVLAGVFGLLVLAQYVVEIRDDNLPMVNSRCRRRIFPASLCVNGRDDDDDRWYGSGYQTRAADSGHRQYAVYPTVLFYYTHHCQTQPPHRHRIKPFPDNCLYNDDNALGYHGRTGMAACHQFFLIDAYRHFKYMGCCPYISIWYAALWAEP